MTISCHSLPCLVCTLWLAGAVLAAAALVAALPGPALVQPGAVPRGAALPARAVTHVADAETLIRFISAYIDWKDTSLLVSWKYFNYLQSQSRYPPSSHSLVELETKVCEAFTVPREDPYEDLLFIDSAK